MNVSDPNRRVSVALAAARQRGNRRATRQLEAIGPPPHLNAKQFATRGNIDVTLTVNGRPIG